MWYVDVGEPGVIYALTMAIFYTVIWGSQFHNTTSIDNRKTVSLNSEYKFSHKFESISSHKIFCYTVSFCNNKICISTYGLTYALHQILKY